MIGGLFGLLFAAGGVFIASETIMPTFQDWRVMQSWKPHKAILLSVSGGDTSTEATYRYELNGKAYQGNRVHVAAYKDNIGDYQGEMYEHLNHLYRNKREVQIFLDPRDPWQSVIDRNMRWGLFALASGFCGIFFLIGVIVIYASFVTPSEATFKPPSMRKLRREFDTRKSDPSFKQSFLEYRAYRLHELKQQSRQKRETQRDPEAWQGRDGWQENGIRSESRRGTIVMWGFAVLWNAISSPLLFQFEEELEKGNYAIIIGLLFPMVGIYLLYKAVAMTLEYQRYGVIKLMMDPFPGSIGGHIGGTLTVKTPNDDNADYRIGVECVYSYVSGSGDSRSRSERIRWAEEGSASVRKVTEGVLLSFRFNVPEDLPEADAEQTDDYYFWRLHLHADVPGVNLDRKYNIPVVAEFKESQAIGHDLSAQVQALRLQQAEVERTAIERGDFSDTDLARSMRIYDRPGEFELYQPMFRNKFLAMFLSIFGGGFSAASWAVFDGFADYSVMGIFSVVFIIPFALIGVVCVLGTFYLLFNSLTVKISRRNVSIKRSLFLVPVMLKDFKPREVTSMSIKKTGSTGQGNHKIEHYKIEANYNRGDSITLAEDIDGEDLANSFKDYLFQRIQYG